MITRQTEEIHDRAYHIVMRNIIQPVLEKRSDYVGVEVEIPICRTAGAADLKESGCLLLEKLVDEYGFEEEIRGNDDCLVRVRNQAQDAVSFDYYYGTIEYSMHQSPSLIHIADRFFKLLITAEEFYKEMGWVLTGMGSNLKPGDPHAYTNDPFYRVIRQYMQNCTAYKDPACFFTNMQSTQTHIDLKNADLTECYNLFNGLDFARGMLFANSLPAEAALPQGLTYPDHILCARDFLWENCGLPNTGSVDQEFKNLEEIAESMEELELFVENREGVLTYREPISLREYFKEESHTAEALNCYRSFQNVVLNGYHVLEVRGDCTQPLSDLFAPCAFNVGIAYRCHEAAVLLKEFKEKNHLTQPNSVLRRMAVCGERIAEDGRMKEFLAKLLTLAKEGLKDRGYGEEQFLGCLRERAESLVSPAAKIRQLQEEGCPDEEIIRLYAQHGRADPVSR